MGIPQIVETVLRVISVREEMGVSKYWNYVMVFTHCPSPLIATVMCQNVVLMCNTQNHTVLPLKGYAPEIQAIVIHVIQKN